MFFSLPYDDFMIYSTIRGAKVGKISELCKFFAANRPKIITEKVDSNACGAFEKFCPLLSLWLGANVRKDVDFCVTRYTAACGGVPGAW